MRSKLGTTRTPHLLLPALALALATAACGGLDAGTVLRGLQDECTLSSDCADDRACVFGTCHDRCTTSKDCPLDSEAEHLSCIAVNATRVCQFEEERECALHSDCPGDLVCGADDHCRSQCGSDRDCIDDQVCTAATCADTTELGPGGTLALGEGTAREGKPCLYTTDCGSTDALDLTCREGICALSCAGDDRDCGRYQRCVPDLAAGAFRCEAIGFTHCSPHPEEPDSAIGCACLGGAGTQYCLEDGSGYGPCTIGGEPCSGG